MTPISHSLTSTPNYHPYLYNPEADLQAEFGRLIHAAIINSSFQRQLLSNPSVSIENGYCGETFHFPVEIRTRIENIRAVTLEDFSSQLMQVTVPTRIKEAAIIECQ